MPPSECHDGGESADSTIVLVSGLTEGVDDQPVTKVTGGAQPLGGEGPACVMEEKLDKLLGITAVHELIGKGEFSSIYRCSVDGLGEVAVKTFSLGVSLRDVIYDLETIRHPNLVNVFRLNATAPICIIMELCGPTLFQVLHQEIGDSFPMVALPEMRLATAAGIISAVAYLHSHEILHRNIASSSCHASREFGSEPVFKLGEFTMARSVSHAAMTKWTGNFVYMAPEVMDDDSYGFPTDVFSCGILLHEIATRKLPYGGESNPRLLVRVIRGHRPPASELPELAGGSGDRRAELLTLLESCWDGKAESRTSSQEAAARLQSLLLQE